MTCHRGQERADLQVAHTGIVKDPTLHFEEECLLCHRSLPDEIPGDRLRTPHSSVVHGLAQGITCSDCHIVVYCYTGHTGQVASVAMALLGYNVVNLKYGMMGWTDDDEVLAQPRYDADTAPDYPIETEPHPLP